MALILPTLRDIQNLVGPDRQSIVWPIAEGLQLSSDGTTGARSLDVTAFPYSGLAAYVQSVQACTATESKSANARWKVQASGSTTGRTYNTAVDLFAYLSANGETTETAYTSVSNLGLTTRYALVCSNVSGTAVESVVVWCYLVFRLRT